jgi:hypothetical protein
MVRRLLAALRDLLEGRRAEAIAALQALAGILGDAEGLYYLARQLAYAGAADEAIALLGDATTKGFHCSPLLESDEWFDPIRDRPAFTVVLRQMQQEHDLALAAFAAAGGDRILGVD